jgi:hypothetical protein
VTIPEAMQPSLPTSTSSIEITKELAALDIELARCMALATQSTDEELGILVGILSERARLLRKLLNQ